MSLRSVRKCSGCLHLHYLSSNFLQILWGNKEARQTTVDHSASSWYSPDPLHEPTSEHNERTPLSPFPLKSSGSQGRQNSSEDGGYLRSIPSETAALGVPSGVLPSSLALVFRAEGLSGFTEIELGTILKRQQMQPTSFSTHRLHSSVESTAF